MQSRPGRADRELAGLRTAYGDLTDRFHAAQSRAAAAQAQAADAAGRADAAEREAHDARLRLDEVLRRRRVRAGLAAGRGADLLRRVTGR